MKHQQPAHWKRNEDDKQQITWNAPTQQWTNRMKYTPTPKIIRGKEEVIHGFWNGTAMQQLEAYL